MGFEKTEKMGFVEELGEIFASKNKNRTLTVTRIDSPQNKEALLQLKKLESEHIAKIDLYLKQIEKLKEEREKLGKAINLLKEINLEVSEEYLSRLNRYSDEIEKLELAVEREQNFLDYLRTRVFPLI